jgi:hypothetical protein
MTTNAVYYDELTTVAEYLAARTADREERAEHLKMAGTYHQQARLAGSRWRPAVVH